MESNKAALPTPLTPGKKKNDNCRFSGAARPRRGKKGDNCHYQF